MKTFTPVKDSSHLYAGDLATVITNDFVEWRSVTNMKKRGYFLREIGSTDPVKVPISVDDVCLVLKSHQNWVTILTSNGNIGDIQHHLLNKIN